MNATLDKFGRIIIPKKLRTACLLQSGDKLLITQTPDGILLKPKVSESPIKEKDGILVFSGDLQWDQKILQNSREERINHLLQI